MEKLKLRLPVHDAGTLQGLTRWINKHDEGFAELLKNVRAAYQENRANVDPNERSAIILIKDSDKKEPARIGVLDVGGFTFEDIQNWSIWNNPDASSRGGIKQEENQGNGGKAYMYRLFTGPAFIVGVKNNKKNQVGFVGKRNSLERGMPRFMITGREVWHPGDVLDPNEKEEDVPVENWKEDLVEHLFSLFKTGWNDLPKDIQNILEKRNTFTLVACEDPINWSNGKSNVKQFIRQVIKYPQSSKAIQQIKFYVIYNGRLLFDKPIELEKIEPYPKFEGPFEYEIPPSLLTPNKHQINTLISSSGQHSPGKITLLTSKENMESAYKTLKPRWVVNYSTELEESIGQKSISEISPNTPGTHFIYAHVELNALGPDSVDSGRKRPNDTPLVLAVDEFLKEKIKELAKNINETRKQAIDESALDEIQKDNEFLNALKNDFLPSEGDFDFGSVGDGDYGKKKKKSSKINRGELAKKIKISSYNLKLSRGFKTNLNAVLNPSARDSEDRPVFPVRLKWTSLNKDILDLDEEGNCLAKKEGNCKIKITIEGNEDVETPPILVEVFPVDKIILNPPSLQIPVGRSKQIKTQISSNKKILFNVLINWEHDAPNKNMVKISPKGYVFGNILGKGKIKGVVDDPIKGEISSENSVEVEIIKSNEKGEKGEGFPQLLITEKDIDRETGKPHPSDPEGPLLIQDPSDYKNNVWWLNLQSRDANFAHKQREKDIRLWRLFHVEALTNMMLQVHMDNEYTKKQENELKDVWNHYKSKLDIFESQIKPKLWEKLIPWIQGDEEE